MGRVSCCGCRLYLGTATVVDVLRCWLMIALAAVAAAAPSASSSYLCCVALPPPPLLLTTALAASYSALPVAAGCSDKNCK